MKTLTIILSIYAFYAVVYAIFCFINWVAEELKVRRYLKESLAHYNEELDRLEFIYPRIRERERIKGIVPEHLQIERKSNIQEWLKAMRLFGNCRVNCAYILSNVCSKCGSKVLAVYITAEYYEGVNIICLRCGNVLWFDRTVISEPLDPDEKPTPVLIKCLLLIFVPIWVPIVLVIYIIYLICNGVKKFKKSARLTSREAAATGRRALPHRGGRRQSAGGWKDKKRDC